MACMGKEKKSVEVFDGTARKKKPLVRPRHRWEGEIKMYSRKIG
jgi:hypothetical protein